MEEIIKVNPTAHAKTCKIKDCKWCKTLYGCPNYIGGHNLIATEAQIKDLDVKYINVDDINVLDIESKTIDTVKIYAKNVIAENINTDKIQTGKIKASVASFDKLIVGGKTVNGKTGNGKNGNGKTGNGKTLNGKNGKDFIIGKSYNHQLDSTKFKVADVLIDLNNVFYSGLEPIKDYPIYAFDLNGYQYINNLNLSVTLDRDELRQQEQPKQIKLSVLLLRLRPRLETWSINYTTIKECWDIWFGYRQTYDININYDVDMKKSYIANETRVLLICLDVESSKIYDSNFMLKLS